VKESPVNPLGGDADGTSLSLLEKARSGSDQAAWERLASLYEPLVIRWCRLDGFQDADAEDLRQEVFMSVSRSLGEFQRGSQGSFRGWLHKIAKNKMHDLWERKKTTPQAPGGTDSDGPIVAAPSPQDSSSSESTADEETGILYRRALELISRDFGERTWKAFWRVVIDGQRPRDVAGELSMTAGAVSSAKARVLARLRQEFAGLLGE
jgi:RNA polymerase sigma-70 factor (ECF subfamily)